ncbi:hypothetical protein AAG570_005223 [Ranatra chinensis]|uniref:Transposase n=1 Tax=Ranatra chinensis TaxID=642074 RepID=A0ABD0XZV4_9HEMI
MVFGCVSSEDDVMPPHFFREGLRLTSDGYVELLNTVVKPWIRRAADGRPYVWQQDSAPCHTSGKNQKWLSENFYDSTSPNVWPPNSPDPNPMDYFVWGAVEKDTDRPPSNTKAQFIKMKVFAALPRETVASACSEAGLKPASPGGPPRPPASFTREVIPRIASRIFSGLRGGVHVRVASIATARATGVVASSASPRLARDGPLRRVPGAWADLREYSPMTSGLHPPASNGTGVVHETQEEEVKVLPLQPQLRTDRKTVKPYYNLPHILSATIDSNRVGNI